MCERNLTTTKLENFLIVFIALYQDLSCLSQLDILNWVSGVAHGSLVK